MKGSRCAIISSAICLAFGGRSDCNSRMRDRIPFTDGPALKFERVTRALANNVGFGLIPRFLPPRASILGGRGDQPATMARGSLPHAPVSRSSALRKGHRLIAPRPKTEKSSSEFPYEINYSQSRQVGLVLPSGLPAQWEKPAQQDRDPSLQQVQSKVEQQ